jgi:hypothetical protein
MMSKFSRRAKLGATFFAAAGSAAVVFGLAGSGDNIAGAAAPPFNLIDESLALNPVERALFAKGSLVHRPTGSKSAKEAARDALDERLSGAVDGFYQQIASDPRADALRSSYSKCAGVADVPQLNARVQELFVLGNDDGANKLIALDESCQAQTQSRLDALARSMMARWKSSNAQILADYAKAQIDVGNE